MQPGLLVSVRNAREAISAWRGGADIIDLKEPLNGPLGAVSDEVPAEVLDSLRQMNASSGVVLSVALGEARDWCCPIEENSERGALLAALQQVASNLQFLKTGLSTDPNSTSPGQRSILQHWADIRNQIDNRIGRLRSSNDGLTSGGPNGSRLSQSLPARSPWVAVAYADFERSGAPSVAAVLEAAIQTNCRGLLIDTFLKDGRGLFVWCSPGELNDIRERTRDAGLFLALAGQITAAAMDQLRRIQPDVIAVRGSVCRSGARMLEIEEEAVRRLKQQIAAAF